MASSVLWNCFVAEDASDRIGAPGVSIHHYGDVTPEILFTYSYNLAGKVTSATSTGEGCNLGWPTAYWVLANAGDILTTKADYQAKEILYNYGYPGITTSTEGTTLSISANKETYYFAILGDNYMAGDWYGWVEVSADSSGLTVVNSALSYDKPLIVGGGVVPEPSSGLLFITGVLILSLRRKSRQL